MRSVRVRGPADGDPAPPVSPSLVAQMDQYLHAHRFRYVAEFQPDDRFWTFQLIEAAIFFAFAVMLFALGASWLQSRMRYARCRRAGFPNWINGVYWLTWRP